MDMPMAKPAQAQAPEQGAEALLENAQSNLMQLMALVDKAQGLPPEAKAALAQALSGVQGFAEVMSGGAKPEAPKQAPMPGASTPEAGANPNAKPMMM